MSRKSSRKSNRAGGGGSKKIDWKKAALFAAGGLAVGGLGSFLYAKFAPAAPAGRVRGFNPAGLLMPASRPAGFARPAGGFGGVRIPALAGSGATAIEHVAYATGASKISNRYAALGNPRTRIR